MPSHVAFDAEGREFVWNELYVSASGHLLIPFAQPFTSANLVEGHEIRWRNGEIREVGDHRRWHGETLIRVEAFETFGLSRQQLTWLYDRKFNEGPARARVRAEIAARKAKVAALREHGQPLPMSEREARRRGYR